MKGLAGCVLLALVGGSAAELTTEIDVEGPKFDAQAQVGGAYSVKLQRHIQLQVPARSMSYSQFVVLL